MSEFYWEKEYHKYLKDPDFEIKFKKFLQEMMDKVRDPDIPLIRVDEELNNFILDYISKKRKNSINKILRKKDI